MRIALCIRNIINSAFLVAYRSVRLDIRFYHFLRIRAPVRRNSCHEGVMINRVRCISLSNDTIAVKEKIFFFSKRRDLQNSISV